MCSYLKMHIPYSHALKTKQNKTKILLREIARHRAISCHVTMGWHDASRIRPILRMSFALKWRGYHLNARVLPGGSRRDRDRTAKGAAAKRVHLSLHSDRPSAGAGGGRALGLWERWLHFVIVLISSPPVTATDYDFLRWGDLGFCLKLVIKCC